MKKDHRPLAWRASLYRIKAEQAVRSAGAAVDPQAKDCWRRLAVSWRELADTTDRLIESE